MITKLDWDSNFFGFNVGSAKIGLNADWDKIISEFSTDSANYKLIFFISPANQVVPSEILYRFGGKLINQRLIYTKQLSPINNKFPGYIKEYHSSKLTEDLKKLAILSGAYSRFKIDTNFPPGKFEELYHLWIKNSLNKQIADQLFISSRNERITAMVSNKIIDSVCHIGLVAVDKSEQGQGTGGLLIRKTEYHAYAAGLREIRVPTQSNNQAACRFYEKLGFSLFENWNFYHFWIK